MFKKLIMGGIISMFLITMSVPAFAASTCPLNRATGCAPSISNCQNLSQYIQKCNNCNPTLAQALRSYQQKCNNCNQSNVQSAYQQKCNLQNLLNNFLRSCPTAARTSCNR